MITKYEKGLPCMMGDVVGRIVGESDEGQWGEINGTKMFSIPLFSTPHGTIFKAGLFYLNDISDEGMERLIEYEKQAEQEGELYDGRLKNLI